ncbi:aspartate aminotransferase family protein [Haliangium sp.]|uniref:class-III pyridoxal-phosphate-dependent aminotransferase n=1 Tax=Haliangium sp. TaxID=2663208 RepID=UPI003D0CE8AE
MTSSIEAMIRDGWDGFRRFVNPLVTARAQLLGEPFEAIYAEDGRLGDGERWVEDFHGTQSFGHRHPAITAAVMEYLGSNATNWYPSRVNPIAGSLAARVCERAGGDYERVFFASSGSEAVEAALKLGRAATRRPRILSLRGAYHGTTMGSCALIEPGMFRDRFGPHLPGVEALPFADEAALAAALASEDVAAVIVEPIQLEGGVRPLPSSYVEALCALTERHGALLVADEIQTGLGRTGRFLASETWPRRPDAIVIGKHFGGGLMPLSAMVTHADVFERAYGDHYAGAEAHNTTFSGNAAACVAGHAALDLLTDELMERNRTLGERFRAALSERLARHELFDEVRGAGMIAGIALRAVDHPWLSFEHFGLDGLADQPTTGVILCYRLYKRGYYGFVCGHDWRVLRLLPRFNILEKTLDELVDHVDEELEKLCALI